MKLYDFFVSIETPFVFVHTSFCQHKQKSNDTGFFFGEVGVAGAIFLQLIFQYPGFFERYQASAF